MNRAAFFAALRQRASGVFGTSLTQGQVDGVEAILDSCARNRIGNAHHVANILAQVYHETGGRMLPVRETFAASDQQAINRLEAAWKAGNLKWVKTPYWRPDADGRSWFGRGPIQITHKANYAKLGQRLGVNLAGNPSLALDPKIGADIAVVGMSEGLFTGRKLSDFAFPAALTAPVASNPRRIVNGQDGTDAKVAGYHRAFLAAIEAGGGWSMSGPSPLPKPTPAPSSPPAEPSPQVSGGSVLVAFLVVAAMVAAIIFLS